MNKERYPSVSHSGLRAGCDVVGLLFRGNMVLPEAFSPTDNFGDINAEECWSSRLGNQHHHAQIFHCKVAYQKMQLVSRWGTSPIVFRPGSWEIIYALTEPFF